ncbi:MAG: alanine dehydrogenase [Cytophagaceae bacterium]|nr:alanine dehydrogenase [Cytophagaceae bacterium]MDW8456553.1 alanine dehydrogenase [Cytophagaceae bacterium]
MKGKITSLVKEHALYPQEQLMKVKNDSYRLNIGIPKEQEGDENRICLTPEAVSVLINDGHEVVIETGAGVNAKYTDRDFSEAGARIVYTKKEVFQSDIILKVNPPTLEEIEYMKSGKTLISALQTGKLQPEFLEAINKQKITALAYEYIEDKAGGKPLVKSMSEIAGSTVMLIAAEYLNSYNGKGVIVGGITGVPPTKVVILGAGTVAEYAARAALGLGAEVKVFDHHIYKLRRLRHAVGTQIYTSTIDSLTLRNELKRADVVIGSVRSDEGSPFVVTEELVAEMRPNSVIIDVSIDQGGCFETSRLTSHKNPVFVKYDVIHYCVPNIPSRVARTATTALSNIFTPMMLQIASVGGVDAMIYSKEWFMKGVYAYRGNLTNPHLARRFNMKYSDLEIIMATRY